MRWLGRLDYQKAWDLQHDLVARRAAGEVPDQLLLVEHQPVLTLGRQSDPAHIRATAEVLAERGIEVIRVERGGEVTYHGPGQLVAYPIVRLADRSLLIRPFVRVLEDSMAQTAADFGVTSGPARRPAWPLVRPNFRPPPEGRRPRSAHRARRELSRHRLEHHDQAGRLRSD